MNMEKNILDTYFSSHFQKLNDLSRKGFDHCAKVYSSIYKDFLPRDKNLMILDLGCGTGQFLYFLEKEGYRNYYGVDGSKQQIQFCKENGIKNVELSDAFKFLETKKDKFDVVVANDFLEHIQKQKLFEILDLIYNSLKTGGVLLLKVPNMSNPFGLKNRYMDITHEIGFTEFSLSEALEMSGFKDVKVRGAPYIVTSVGRAFGRVGKIIIHSFLKLLFLVQGYSVPKFLDSNIVASAIKK